MNFINVLICWLRGHEWRSYDNGAAIGSICVRCGLVHGRPVATRAAKLHRRLAA